MIVLKDMQKLTTAQITALIGKIRAIVYTRVSSDIQIDNYSLESQIDICVKDAKAKFDINEDEIIVLREEAESGDNPNRPMLNYILFLLQKGLGTKAIFLHPDRLSRHLHLQQQITHQIWELGCDLHFVEFDLQKGNAESMLNYNIQGSIAQYNKAKILANTKRGRSTMVFNNKIPGMNRIYGYTYDKDLNTLVENEYEKERYLTMVNMVLEGSTGSEVAAYLAKKKHPAPKGDKWYQATISRILRNESYMGTYYYGKTEVVRINGKKKQLPKPRDQWQKITIPAYIDEITFGRLQKCLDGNIKNGGRPSEDYLLKGIARCGRCGAAASSGITSRTHNGLLKYYSCTRKTRKSYSVETGEPNKICLGENWRVDMVDSLIWNEVVKLIDNPKTLIDKMLERISDVSKVKELERNRDDINKLIKEKESSKARYIDLYADGIIKSKEELSIKLEPVEDEISELNKELGTISENLELDKKQNKNTSSGGPLVKKYQNIINNELQMKDARKVLRILVDKIVLHDNKRIEIFYKFTADSKLFRNNPYVSESVNLDKLKWVVDSLPPKWSEIEHLYPSMLKMYNEDLLSFEQIAEATKTDWWTIKQMFKSKGTILLTTKERGVKRRASDFEWIYKLHYEDGLAFTKIYKEHGLSPTYCKQVLEENINKLKK
ncbi:recombinase family protein [Paenibacillus sp. CFBP 13594]|uniref:recombinase family protein n=1 Tax=Paenibacillus sp. CFBP 13594 TaxID=2774037 RepID=UPI00178776FA|nr:recombinase family protein [Paenibacillus sp. CFBP 13594]MBD8839919.1 recombinase family protein [Paenibacillus sp. CFBP 13594]